MEQLWGAGANVQAYDPEAMQEISKVYGNEKKLLLVETKEKALQGADALVICTEWHNFRVPDFDLLESVLKEKVIFDGRNMYDPAIIKEHGMAYIGIGRRSH